MRARPGYKHVKRTQAKGLTYYYFDTGQLDKAGKKIWKRLPDPRSKEFGGVYASMMGHRARRAATVSRLSVSGLIDLYQMSPQFLSLSDATRKIYLIYQGEFVERIGASVPADAVERKDIVLLLDRMAGKPGASNMVLASVRSAYSWARKRGHVDIDPCRDIDALELGEHEPWPQAALDVALAADDARVKLAVHLLYYTAQRISDVVKMRWADIDQNSLAIVQKKTGKDVAFRLHTALAAELDRHDRRSEFILSGVGGRPLAAVTLREAIQRFCKKKGFTVVPHGLRKNAVNALLEAGCSVAETAAISGQTLQVVEHYAKKRNVVRLGNNAIDKWEAAE